MSTYAQLEKLLTTKHCGAFALIDPDIKNDGALITTIEKINCSGFDAILVGGSLIQDDNFDTDELTDKKVAKDLKKLKK